MQIKIVTDKISEKELREIAVEFYVTMIKGVVDIKREILAMGGEYHMDANNVLIDTGSVQENIWGFNIYFDKNDNDRIEYTSLINIRPKQNNFTLEITDEKLQHDMLEVIKKRTDLWK